MWLLSPLGRVRLGLLVLVLAAGTLAPAWVRAEMPAIARADDVALTRLAGRARALEISPWNQYRGDHFQVVGDVDRSVLQSTSQILDRLADDFVAHFRSRGFRVALPPYWLSAVVLKDHPMFQAYLGHEILRSQWREEHVTGMYVASLNYSFFYIRRPPGPGPAGRPRPATSLIDPGDLVTWAHEATHELCYNTGLISRWGDAPSCIKEGLAQYCEDRRLSGPSTIGGIDRTAFNKLATAPRKGLTWIALEQLLTEDDLAMGREGTDRTSEFYGEGWALVHLLMTRHTAAFRSYLEAIPRIGPDAPKRLEVARAQLGDLEQLDREFKPYAEQLLGTRILPAPQPARAVGEAPGPPR